MLLVLASHVSKEVLVVLHCSQWLFCLCCCCLHLLGSLHSLLSASHGNPARKALKLSSMEIHRSNLNLHGHFADPRVAQNHRYTYALCYVMLC